MAATVYTLNANWDSANSIVASEDTDTFITALNWTVRWVTTDGSAPSIDPHDGHPVRPQTSHGLTIPSGSTLWLTGNGKATVET